MVTLNAGSIANNLIAGISPIPSSVSGLLLTIVNNKRYLAEQFTGQTVGDAIPESFQSPITDLAFADTLRFMAAQDMGVSSVNVGGELITNNQNLVQVAQQIEERGMQQLKWLVKGLKLYRARG